VPQAKDGTHRSSGFGRERIHLDERITGGDTNCKKVGTPDDEPEKPDAAKSDIGSKCSGV